MSSPVQMDSPKTRDVRTRSEEERDLQEQVQRMISLQYQQQKLASSGSAQDEPFSGGRRNSDADQGSGLMMSKRRSTRTNANLMNLGDAEGKQETDKLLQPSNRNSNMNVESTEQDLKVGKGTLVFSDNLRGSKYATGGSSLVADQQQDNKGISQNREQYTQQLPPHSSTLGSQQQQQQNFIPSALPQQFYSGYGSVQDQNHEFHYGNPDYQLDEPDYYYDGAGNHQRGNKRSSLLARVWACVYEPIADLLSQQNLHRSFCYGGIDGLLTGSGIASAFWGLGLLSVRTPIELRTAVVAFTMAACFADSLCMAMGHVWTTYIVTSNHAWERSYERQLLERDKADAKGKLVEMLLARGMLKIDAMSLADTLEGYPDLFVSALVGDSLLSSGIQDALLDEPSETDYTEQYQQRIPMYSDPATDFDGTGGFLGSFASWTFPHHYYGSERNVHRDLALSHVRVVSKESQKEGIFMLLGFSFFAMIPSILWLILPLWIDVDVSPSKTSSTMSPSHVIVDDGQSVNIPSLIILILSAIVWSLGVWKSQFVDSNWVVFGLETVAVLIVCISSAYGIAASLMYVIGLNESASGGMTLLDKYQLMLDQ